MLTLCIQAAFLNGADKPLLVVLDPESPSLSEREKILVTDLFVSILYSSGRCSLVSRTERNRLLVMNQYRTDESFAEDEYGEVARITFADYIVAGTVTFEAESCTARFGVYDTRNVSWPKRFERRYAGFDELVRDSGGICVSLLEGVSARSSGVEERVIEALGPVPIKEKILFAFASGVADNDEAACRDVIYRVVSMLTGSPRFIPIVAELVFDRASQYPESIVEAARLRGCSYSGFVRKSGTAFAFSLADAEGREAAVVVSESGPESVSGKIYETIASLPARDTDSLVTAVEKNISLEQKVEELLAIRKTMERRFVAGVSGRIFKSAFIPFLQPVLNLLSCEANLTWFYDEHFGMGGGYGFSMDFAGTFDTYLENHPRIYQHEIRLVPFCYRTGGEASFVASVIASVSIHNMYLITTHINAPPTYGDLGFLAFVKTGINFGSTFRLSDGVSLSVDWVTAYLAIPVISHPQNSYPLSFSGDLLGIGLTFGF